MGQWFKPKAGFEANPYDIRLAPLPARVLEAVIGSWLWMLVSLVCFLAPFYIVFGGALAWEWLVRHGWPPTVRAIRARAREEDARRADLIARRRTGQASAAPPDHT